MKTPQSSLDTIKDIHAMMERSSRFISLSGWSGVAAGICALIGSWFAGNVLRNYRFPEAGQEINISQTSTDLLLVGALTLIGAFLTAFLFTYRRSRKTGIPVWGRTARQLVLNVSIPLLAGGLLVVRLVMLGEFDLVAPACLIIYGIALFCGSKQTVGEIRYLAICEMILGCFALWVPGWGLYSWTVGFGLLHIIYGIVMWWKYERRPDHA